jgi:hypothetical protein
MPPIAIVAPGAAPEFDAAALAALGLRPRKPC